MRERERERERVRIRRQKERQCREFTVFVSNLPYCIDRYRLKGVFNRAGQVSDAHIPQRRSQGRNARYGFVRFSSLREASRSIALLNNVIIRKHRIQVSMARSRTSNNKHGKVVAKESARFSQPRVKQI